MADDLAVAAGFMIVADCSGYPGKINHDHGDAGFASLVGRGG
jgi:hypothetical protein